MKTIMRALGISLIIHFIYFFVTWIVGYLKTRDYQPNIAKQWGEVEMLQNEVAFGTVGTPLILLFSFFGIALISGLIIIFVGKFVGLKVE